MANWMVTLKHKKMLKLIILCHGPDTQMELNGKKSNDLLAIIRREILGKVLIVSSTALSAVRIADEIFHGIYKKSSSTYHKLQQLRTDERRDMKLLAAQVIVEMIKNHVANTILLVMNEENCQSIPTLVANQINPGEHYAENKNVRGGDILIINISNNTIG